MLADGVDLVNDEFVVYKDDLNHYCELMIPMPVHDEQREFGSRQASTRGSDFGARVRRVETSHGERRKSPHGKSRKTLKRLQKMMPTRAAQDEQFQSLLS